MNGVGLRVRGLRLGLGDSVDSRGLGEAVMPVVIPLPKRRSLGLLGSGVGP